MDNKTQNGLANAIKTYWPLALVASSIIAQWAVFGIRIQNVEDRLDRQTTAIAEVRSQLTETQNQYAALNAKLDGIDKKVDYILNRVDAIPR